MTLPADSYPLDGVQLVECLKDPEQQCRTKVHVELEPPDTRVEFVRILFDILLHVTSCFHFMEF